MAGQYSVPKGILAMKPTGVPCTVKLIGGHYYVYEHRRVPDGSTGRMKNASGRLLGKITPSEGFVPRGGRAAMDDAAILDCGDYAIGLFNSLPVLSKLREYFCAEDADRLYCMGLIYFVNGFTPIRDFLDAYEGSILSLRFPGLAMGESSVGKWLRAIGRRQGRMLKFEQSLIDDGSGLYAVDGHVILGCSSLDDLCSYGNKYQRIGNTQRNFMCVYDVEMMRVVTCRPFDCGTLDKTFVEDILGTFAFRGCTLIVDAGFYSERNIRLLSGDGRHYVIPLPSSLTDCKEAMADLSLPMHFAYEKGKGKRSSKALISYREGKASDGARLIVFRDEEMHDRLCAEYVSQIGMAAGHTEESYAEVSGGFGVIALQTNMDGSASEVYGAYKKRWGIETYYNHMRNGVGFSGIHGQDYYAVQAEGFIMALESLIHSAFMRRLQESKDKRIKGKSQNECLSISSRLKISKHADGTWHKGSLRSTAADVISLLGVDMDTLMKDLTRPICELLETKAETSADKA